MLRILHDTKIDFIRLWKVTTVVTLLFILPGLLWIAVSGYKYSIEFTGGTLMQVHFAKAPNVSDLRSTLDQTGIKGAEIAQFGTDLDYVIRAQDPRVVAQQTRGAESVAGEIQAALTKKYGPSAFTVQRTEAVGPKVGGELRQKALLAILISFVATLAYLAWRFEWRFGVAAVLATAHDILTTLAFIKYMNLEVSLVVVSAILAVVGYSLNDTIIIFDRTRENLHKYKREDLAGLLNRSINETLPRSILTHSTSLATTLALLVFAGEVIRPFAWVMAFGIFTGTFSSIYIAAPVLMIIERRWPGTDARGVKARVMPAGTPAGSAPSSSGIRVPGSR
jgi:preprotein translocase subunit SecF